MTTERGVTVTFSCDATGTDIASVTWVRDSSMDDVTIANERATVTNTQTSSSLAINSILNIENVTALDGGIYRCLISNKSSNGSAKIFSNPAALNGKDKQCL